ncbi:hypothetical protein [Bifidobacterium vespertilionis]|uniref:hypothetical protein n=1 Tax=Bifidobacterium vespertilionis TaxID=2562524 RepID=UPI001BDC18A3|nr:hypothetical protein [Bifidobacterium vespertilionis]MBT1179936.1 hypothetical protein [Bifidobacterium vespertilionis]
MASALRRGIAAIYRTCEAHSLWVFYAAMAFLPIDGTVLGGYMPYWTPISPWLFILYVVFNGHPLREINRVYLLVSAFPAVLLGISMFGWITVGFRPDTVWLTACGLAGASAGLLSLYIALSVNKVPCNKVLNLLIVAYSISFAMGMVEFIAIRGGLETLAKFLEPLFSRQYLVGAVADGYGRPQFLFAEPSYIGMHLFGVLLPLYWIARKRRVLALILTYAVGSIVMGSGVRILLDCIIAALTSCIVLTDWHTLKSRIVATVSSLSAATLLVIVCVFNPRVQALITNGLFSADKSMAARLLRFLIPIEAGLHDFPHLLFGFGAGNIYDSFGVGMPYGLKAFQTLNHGVPYPDGSRWTDVQHLSTPYGMFTMSAYSSLLAEFGILGIVLLIAMVIRLISIKQAWNPKTVGWLLLVAYLYIQFEGYAFYALPLFLWNVITEQPPIQSVSASIS